MISPEKIAGPWLVLAWKLSKSGMSLRQFEAVYAPKIDAVADPVIDDRDALAAELLTLRAERDEARERAVEAVEAFIENLELEDRGLVRAKRGMAPRRLTIANQIDLLRKVAMSVRSTLSPEDSHG